MRATTAATGRCFWPDSTPVGATPRMLAASMGHLAVVKVLLEASARVDQQGVVKKGTAIPKTRGVVVRANGKGMGVVYP